MKVPQSGLYMDNPAFPLLQGLISYWGVTTADGLGTGLTLICANLANEPSYDGHPVKILSGPAAGQVRTIEVHAGNTLTVGVPFSNNPAGAVQQITASTLFVILSILGGGGGPGPAPSEGLSYYGVVDAVPGANQFTIGSLAGLGAGKFDGVTNPYYAFVLRDAGGAGAAPQGEQQAITAYTTATGSFTTAAFTAAVTVGDEILILHPDLAAALVILADLAVPAADAVANVLERDVIGNKSDTPAGNSTISGIKASVEGVYVDSVLGVAGTAWPIGTAGRPSSNMTEAIAIAVARGLNTFYIHNNYGAVLTIPSALHGYSFIGRGGQLDIINLNGQDVGFCEFHKLWVSGGSTDLTEDGLFFDDCFIDSSYPDIFARHCVLGSISVIFLDAHDVQFQGDTLSLAGLTDGIITNASGSVSVQLMDGGTLNIYGNGLELTIAATCTLGTINIYGNVRVTNNSGGTAVNDYSIDSGLWGADGIATWPARALPANGVSLSEAVRYTAEIKPEWAARTSATHTTIDATEETVLTTTYTVPGLFYFNLTLRNMVAGDDFTIRVYKRVDGANYDLKSEQNFVGAPALKIYEVENLYTDATEFIRVTIQRNSATDRAFPYSVNCIKQPVV